MPYFWGTVGIGYRQSVASPKSWADLFGLVEPGLLIADFSPVALLAARGLIPSVVVGYGFCLPPHEIMSFPPFRDDIPSTAIESTIVANMAVIAEKRHASPLRSAPSLFRAHYSHCFSLPLLDPYAAYRRTPALGPIEPMPRFVPPPGESRLFAYLRADSADTPDLIAALSQLGLSVDIHLRGEGRAMAQYARLRGLTAHA